MLLIQQHLKNKVETPETLQERFGIFSKLSSDGKLRIFDYDQIESSKFKDHRLVKEARGLVLTEGTWDIVAKSFNRFFNYKENTDTEYFDWKNFSSTEKEDGSLFRISVIDNELRGFTRFSFADQPISDLMEKTWSELAFSCLNDEQNSFIKCYSKYTFVFEFCSPYTQVVKFHLEPKLVMLGLFDNQTGKEVSPNNEVYKQAKQIFTWVKEYNFKSIDEIIQYLDNLYKNKSTDEGFVLKDNNGIRLKIKNKYYLQLHRLTNNNDIKNLKSLIPIILNGETDEVETYFPLLKDSISIIKQNIENDLKVLKEIYENVIIKESLKDFALYLTKENFTPWSSLFFQLRKDFGNSFTFTQVENLFMKSEDYIIKIYKSRNILKEL